MKRENLSRAKDIIDELEDIEYDLEHLKKNVSSISISTDRVIYFSMDHKYDLEKKYCDEVRRAAINMLTVLKEQLEKELSEL